jgi:hypothetical protein
LWSVTFGNGRFVAGGSNGRVIRSGLMPPATTVPRIRGEESLRLEDGAMLLAVEAPYGREVAVEASEDLVNWKVIGTDPCDRGEFEVYDRQAQTLPRRFYRARQRGPVADPLDTWEPSTLGSTPIRGIAYGQGRFLALSSSGNRLLTEGSGWTYAASLFPSVTYGGGLFCAAGGLELCTSSDGLAWNCRSWPWGTGLFFDAVIYGNSKFVAHGADLNRAYFEVSEDGRNWREATNPVLGTGRSGGMAFGRATYVYLGLGTPTQWSSNGLDWHPVEAGGGVTNFVAVTYGQGRLWALAGERELYESRDGRLFTRVGEIVPAGTGPFYGLAYGNGVLLAVGGAGRGFSSPDGITWTERRFLPAEPLVSAGFGSGRFAVGGRYGEVYRSGVMPPAVAVPRIRTEDTLRLENGTMLVTVEGPYGRKVTVEASTDLENWTAIATDPNDRGEFEVYDSAARESFPRFYRVQLATP